jgi:hypothetical protein
MAWENIEERLKKHLTVKVSFPAGAIWLPDRHLSIDEWLTSIAETDEELSELNIPRIQFLQNRWSIDRLVELEWDDQFANKRVIAAMYVGIRTYILFSDWGEYQVIAALEPKDNPRLYRAVVGKLLETESFVPTQPTRIRNLRTDLIPDWTPAAAAKAAGTKEAEGKGGMPAPGPAPKPSERWKAFLSHVLEGWIQRWLDIPEAGFFYDDTPESISTTKQEQKRAS